MKLSELSTPTLQFKIAPPVSFTSAEQNAIIKLITSAEQVNADGIKRLFQKAKLIGVAIDQGRFVAVSAIKVPNDSYRLAVFDLANVEEYADKYRYEMGWKIVLPEYRGNNLGAILSRKLLQRVNKPVYATVRSANFAALVPLKSLGFKQLGEPFTGNSGNEITLFVYQ